MTRVALYARYSHDLQRDASIEDQFRICRDQAKREDWRIVGTYKDAAISYPSGRGRLVGLKGGLEAAQLETSLAAVLALLHGPDDLDNRPGASAPVDGRAEVGAG